MISVKPKFDNPIYQEIWRRITYKKQNAMIVITGAVGTGKSLLACKIASDLDPTFNENTIEERVVIEPEQFMELIANQDRASKLKTGNVIIVDEASLQMGNRQWYTINNQMMNYILQTFRYRRLIVIFTLPNLSFLDVHARRMFNLYIETQRIDFKKKTTACKVYMLSYNKMNPKEPYKRCFRIRDKKGRKTRLDIFHFSKVNDDIDKKYESYSKIFKNKIVLEALKTAIRVKNRESNVSFDATDVAKKILANKERYYKNGSKLDKQAIELDFDIGARRVNRVKRAIEDMNHQI